MNGLIAMMATLVLLCSSVSLTNGQKAVVVLTKENTFTTESIEGLKENKHTLPAVDVQAVSKCTTVTSCVTKGTTNTGFVVVDRFGGGNDGGATAGNGNGCPPGKLDQIVKFPQ